jgi:signal transduction histidine kinase
MARSVALEISDELGFVRMRAADGMSPALVRVTGPGVIEATTLDLSGKVIESSSKTPYAYTGDRKWLDGISAGGADAGFIGESFLYEGANTWVLPFEAAVTGPSGAVTGAYRVLVDISSFCGQIDSFTLGSTGDASLVDDKGYLVFRKGAAPFSGKFSGYDDMQKVVSSRKGYTVIEGVYRHQGRVLAAAAPVGGADLVRKGIDWTVFAAQDEREILGALNAARAEMMSTVAAFALAMIPVGYFLGNALLLPVRKIKAAIERIASGEFGVKTGVATGDEMESIGRLLDKTADEMKGRVTTVSSLEGEKAARISAEQKRLQMEYAASRLRGVPAGGKAPDAVELALDIAAVEGGRLALSISGTDLRDILRRALLAFEPRVREKGLDIRSDAPKEVVAVKVDANRIARAINALMEDALAATDKGAIRISARAAKDAVEIVISDTRTGPHPSVGKDAQKIADDNALSILTAKDIIEAHKGRLLSEPDQGGGHRYIIRLPR